LSSWIATFRGRAAAATTRDIERVSLARALDLAFERDGGYDLMDHLLVTNLLRSTGHE